MSLAGIQRLSYLEGVSLVYILTSEYGILNTAPLSGPHFMPG